MTTIIYRDTQYDHVEEHLEKRLSRAELASEIEELIEYYKYYKDCPIVSDRINFQLMLDYWEKIKTVYYRRVQAMLNLPIDEETVHTNLEKNASDLEDQKETKNASTFYIMKYLLGDKQPAK